MRQIITLMVLASISAFQCKETLACEKFTRYSTEEAKEYRDMLNKADADSLDRLSAFQRLVCSDNPILRNYAIQQGLKNSKDPLVRNQVLLDAMMQKERIDIEMYSNDQLTKQDKEFIAKHAGIYSATVVYRSKKEGCIGLYNRDCNRKRSLYIKGNKVEYNYIHVFGAFTLSETNELVGFLRAGNTSDYTRIPAVIKLF